MDNNERTMVEMTPEEKAQFEAFQKEQAKRREAEARAEQRKELQTMANEAVEEMGVVLQDCSKTLTAAKKKAWDTFGTLIEMRKEVNGRDNLDQEQYNFSFMNDAGTMRIRMGYNMLDGWDDTANDGIAKVKDYLESLGKDEESKRLIKVVLRLLAKDTKGNLKASRVIQLGQMADESGSDEFKEGMRIIREAYRPVRSKTYIRCDIKKKNAQGEMEWQDLGLSIQDV